MKNTSQLLLYLNFLFLIFLVAINIGLIILSANNYLEFFNPEYQHPASIITSDSF